MIFLLLACVSTPGVTVEPAAVDRDQDGYLEDCDPQDPRIHPDALDICDGVDNNCDGRVDEPYDLDADGFLAEGCLEGDDCDDRDASFHPGAPETCDGRDHDCDGVRDNPGDEDGDGYDACLDCDDGDPGISPEAVETCDGVDQNCDGAADESFDADGDGVAGCNGDCDDQDAENTPALPERCDGRDNNCDGQADEGLDADADGYTPCQGDCDESNAAVHPNLEEACDGVDNDCDPSTSEDGDLDGDGVTWCDGDCNDRTAAAYPGASEICDGVDDDCDGQIDELAECFDCTLLGSYAVCTLSTTWSNAQEACGYLGGDLVVIHDAAENDEISTTQYSLVGSAAWIGYSDQDREGRFVWVDGSGVGYNNWYSGEPNDSGGEDCAATNFGAIAAWNDYPCSTSLPFICGL